MDAVVLHAPGDIRLEQVPVPAVVPGHALVRVTAVGVCGSDLPRMLTKGAHRMPLVTGHEFAGVVVEADGDVDVAVGQRVTVPPLIPCFKCECCMRGAYSLCRDYSYFGSRRDGAYAEFVLVPATNLLPVPDEVNDEAAALVDPASIALHALMRTPPAPGDRVAVVGAGPIGLFAVQWAQILGAGLVAAFDVMDEKLELARQLGADVVARSDRPHEQSGFDVVVETAGVPVAQNAAVLLAGAHGRIVFIGIPTTDVSLDTATFQHLLREELTLTGSWNSFSAPFPGREWTASIEMMARGRLRTQEIVSHREELERVPELISAMGRRDWFFSKVMFFPHGEEGGR